MDHLFPAFAPLHFYLFFFFKTLTLCKDADFMQVSPIGSSKIHLSHEHFHPQVPKLLCFQFALDNFAGGPCSRPTPASPCIEDRLHHRIPFWCCPNLNPMRTSTATTSHGKVILYLSLKDWASFSRQAFKCWLYQLKKKKKSIKLRAVQGWAAGHRAISKQPYQVMLVEGLLQYLWHDTKASLG